MTNDFANNLRGAKGNLSRGSLTVLSRIIDALLALSFAKKSIIRSWYQCLSALDKEADVTFMNYGYAQLDLGAPEIELHDEDQINRYCAQLYQRVAGAIDLRGKEVLEVGCGRGGGAAFIGKYLKPRSVTGVDFSGSAVAFCKSYYRLEGLSFLHGDAENLPCSSNSFDAVINIESLHCYNSIERFLREVVRVLRPQGRFLIADLCPREQVPSLRERLRQSGLSILEEERITPNVLRALELDNERKLSLIQSKAPKVLRERVQQFAGVVGSPVYRRFHSGEWEYLRFVLQKGGPNGSAIFEEG
jgi:ubiquinone/menaquinone biosynthesis C-methylase UbiE